jgi:hypothetical protein
MKPIAILGIVLVLAGLAGLIVGRVGYTETKPIVKASSILTKIIPFGFQPQRQSQPWWWARDLSRSGGDDPAHLAKRRSHPP